VPVNKAHIQSTDEPLTHGLKSQILKSNLLLSFVFIILALFLLIIFVGIGKTNAGDVPIEGLLEQQSNVISWFSLVSTLVLTFIIFVAGFGIFNARRTDDELNRVTKLIDQSTTLKDELSQLSISLKDAKHWAERLTKIRESVTRIELPDSLDSPEIQQLDNIHTGLKQLDILIIAGDDLPSDKILKAYGYYLRGEFGNALSYLEDVQVPTDVIAESRYHFFTGRCLFELRDYENASRSFYSALSVQSDYLVALYCMIDSSLAFMNKKNITEADVNVKSTEYLLSLMNRDVTMDRALVELLFKIQGTTPDFLVAKNLINEMCEEFQENTLLSVLKIEIEIESIDMTLQNIDENYPVDVPYRNFLGDEELRKSVLLKEALMIGKGIAQFMKYDKVYYQDFIKRSEGQEFIRNNSIKYGPTIK